MNSKAFKFNSSIKYIPGVQQDNPTKTFDPIAGTIEVGAGTSGFKTKYQNVFDKYEMPWVKSNGMVHAWNSKPMQFWQNQLNFAVWCATTGCGVSLQDHLFAEDPQIRSLYRFHFYYQTRRLLDELQVPLPDDQAWKALDNTYDQRAYERLCAEFGVPTGSNWHLRGPNNGLGRAYNYWSYHGYEPVSKSGWYNERRMFFTSPTTNQFIHIDYIRQDETMPHVGDGWRCFIIEKGQGYSHAGVERLNDSIRTYVWAILGAQAQTRTSIVGIGTAFDAQAQYLANVEDAIASPVDLPSGIKRYQDVLQYAGSEVNFVYGHDLYMAPGDMELKVGKVAGYNNLIVIASAEQELGLNKGLNVSHDAPHNAAADTGEKHIVKPSFQPAGGLSSRRVQKPSLTAKPAAQKSKVVLPPKQVEHEDEKTALIVGGVVVGLVAFWFIR